ncbi:MAG: hypothetical protein HZB61_15955 [Nitrospirae bacterium]|nr:hypothetical protein [Nitrospirota bacterium]
MELENIISGCIEMEGAVASIYSTFARLFPEERSFWEDLVRDELEHQLWLTDPSLIEAIDLLPSKDLLPSNELIENSLKFAGTTARQINFSSLTLEAALKIALHLEESMVEIFANELTANLFACDYATLSEKILSAEKIHIDKIEDLMIRKGFMQLS